MQLAPLTRRLSLISLGLLAGFCGFSKATLAQETAQEDLPALTDEPLES